MREIFSRVDFESGTGGGIVAAGLMSDRVGFLPSGAGATPIWADNGASRVALSNTQETVFIWDWIQWLQSQLRVP